MDLTIRDVMKRDFPIVAKDETLEHAIRLMEKYEMDRVVAVKSGVVVGIMTKKDVMMKLATLRTRRVVPGRLHVSSFMTPDPIVLGPSASVVEAAKTMVEKNIGSIPVVESSREPIGLVTRWEIAGLAGNIDAKAADIMMAVPEALKPDNKVLHARQVILKYDLLFMPVVDEEGRVLGYVSIDEVADAFFAFHDIVPEKHRKERIEHLLVVDIMRRRPPVVGPEASIRRVVEEIMSKKSKGAVVVYGDRIVGIITLKELVKLFLLKS